MVLSAQLCLKVLLTGLQLTCVPANSQESGGQSAEGHSRFTSTTDIFRNMSRRIGLGRSGRLLELFREVDKGCTGRLGPEQLRGLVVRFLPDPSPAQLRYLQARLL